MPRHDAVHIAPGLPASGTMRQALARPPSSCLLVVDGYIPRGALQASGSLADWRRLRDAYWTSLSVDPEPSRGSYERAAFHLYERTDALREADSIVLWIGTSLAEQLLLVWLV